MKRPLLSLPHEHGGYLTLLGATVAAMLIAPEPTRALGVGLAMAAGFFARGPLERRARGLALAKLDLPAVVVYGLVAALGLVLNANASLAVTAVVALVGLSIPLIAVVARRARLHRAPVFEYVGMTVMGASAGLAAVAGAATWTSSLAVALVIGTNSLTAVPVVRTEIRRRERPATGKGLLVASVVILAAVAALQGLGHLAVAVGLAPRMMSVVWRGLHRPAKVRVGLVGLRETLVLAGAVIACALLLDGT